MQNTKYARKVKKLKLMPYLSTMKMPDATTRGSTAALLAVSVLLVCMLSSCGGRTMRELKAVEDIVEDYPDSAQVMLANIDTGILNDKCLALYAILKTQADDKLGIPFTTDTLIMKAVDFYGGSRDRYHEAMSWYLLGCVYSGFDYSNGRLETLRSTDLENDAAATDAFLRAKELFPDTACLKYAICEYQLGVRYTNKEMYDDAIQAFRTSRDNYERLDRPDLAGLTDYSIAAVYLLKRDYKTAGRLFYDLTRSQNLTPGRRNDCWLQLAKVAAYGDGNLDSALICVDRYIAGSMDKVPAAGYTLKGQILAVHHENDSAFHYYSLSVANTNDLNTLCLNYKCLADLAVTMKNYQASVNFSKMYETLLDSVYSISSQNQITQVRIRHIEEMHGQRLHQSRVKAATISIVSVLVIAAAILLASIQVDRRRKAYYIQKMDEFRLKQAQEIADKRNARNRDVLISCCDMFRSGTAYNMIMETSVEQRPFRSEERDLLSHDIGLYFADVQKQIRDESPKISTQEFCYMVLKALQFDSRIISDIMCTSQANLRSIKSRIKQKLSQDTFTRFFGE